MNHKFTVGQKVTYALAAMGGTGRNDKFEVVRLLPEAGGLNHYRIKSVVDGHERVATEFELS
jgi:hypothetical protein